VNGAVNRELRMRQIADRLRARCFFDAAAAYKLKLTHVIMF
jgi:hypothetical protein